MGKSCFELGACQRIEQDAFFEYTLTLILCNTSDHVAKVQECGRIKVSFVATQAALLDRIWDPSSSTSTKQ